MRHETTLREREDELAAITASIEGARRGDGTVLLLEGEPGIGKSALLAAADSRAREAGLETLAARGGELEQTVAFGVVRQLFEPGLLAAAAAERAELLSGAARLATPAIGIADGAAESAPGPFDDPAAAIHHGLYWLCVNLAERSPLVLLLDDLHWADAASARWLVYLARRLDGVGVAVIAALRPGERGVDPALIAAVANEPLTRVLRPRGLTEQAAAGMVCDRLGEAAEPSFCAACHQATGGNPFLLGELLEAVRRDAIAPTVASAQTIAELAPEAISRSALLRVARLPAGAEPLARAVAVLGIEAELRHAAELAGLDRREATAAADALIAAALFAAERPLRFFHPLLRTAIYGQIPSAERAALHLRAARMLRAENAAPEQVATHLLCSETTGEAWPVEVLAEAAASASARGAPDAAMAYLRQALTEPDASRPRHELLSALLDAGVAAGRPAVLEDVSSDPIAELTATPDLRLESAGRLSMWLLATSRFDEARQVMDSGIAEAERARRMDLALQLELQRSSVIPAAPADAVARIERYAELVGPDTPEERLWLAQRAWWHSMAATESAEWCADAARRALADGRIFAEQMDTASLSQAIIVLISADRLDEARGWIEQGSDDACRRGSRFGFTGMLSVRSHLAYRQGDMRSAADLGRTAIARSREAGNLVSIPVHLAWLIDALIELGQLAEAEAELVAHGVAGEVPDHYWFHPLRVSRAELRLAAGRADEALEDLRALLAIAEGGFEGPAVYPTYATTALALRALRTQPEEQTQLVERELARARRWKTPRVVGVALRAKALVLGGDEGIELLGDAVTLLAGSPARLEHARALTDFGAALRRAKRRREARAPLREAMELAARSGAAAVADRAREELAATGAKPRRIRLTGVDSLTPSELRIARLAAAGRTNKQIAQQLFVTVKTVEMHLGHAYAKLEISSRDELGDILDKEAAG